MIDFFSFQKTMAHKERPWLVFGKGPSFERHKGYNDLDERFHTISLNHACRTRPVFIAHMIDANVLDEIPNLEAQAIYVLMPWQPHFNFRATDKTLEKLVAEKPVLGTLERMGRLLWYNLVTGPKARAGSPVVKVSYFSAEAVVRLLGMAGVKKIRTLGVDGGSKYAGSFKDIPPFRGGHTTFDLQNAPIQQTVKEFGIDYRPLE